VIRKTDIRRTFVLMLAVFAVAFLALTGCSEKCAPLHGSEMIASGAHQQTLNERVKAGARFLDSVYEGWEYWVDFEKLEMEYDNHSILGQLYGSKGDSLVKLKLDQERAIELGFLITEQFGTTFVDMRYFDKRAWKDLTEEWQREVSERKAAAHEERTAHSPTHI